jgi:hypothetical protein
MFEKARSFNQPVGDWDVFNVTAAIGMFSSARLFNQAIGDWEVTHAMEMVGMFRDARSFNQDLTRGDMHSHMKYTDEMFDGAHAMQADNKPDKPSRRR